MKLQKVAVFLDTNYFYDYPLVENIKWCESMTTSGESLICDSVLIVITTVIIRELNDHKDSGRKPSLSDRAASSLRHIDKYLTLHPHGNTFPVREKVELLLEDRDPEIHHPRNHFINDDHLIESIVRFTGENPETKAVLHTNDVGLKIKARSCGIMHVALPDNFKTPPRSDPRDRKIRDQEKIIEDLNRLRSPEPKFTVTIHKCDIHGVWSEPGPELNLSESDYLSTMEDVPILMFFGEGSKHKLSARTTLVQILIENDGTAPAMGLMFSLSSKTLALHQTRYLDAGQSHEGMYRSSLQIDNQSVVKSLDILRHTFRLHVWLLLTPMNSDSQHSLEWSCYADNMAEKTRGSFPVTLA